MSRHSVSIVMALSGAITFNILWVCTPSYNFDNSLHVFKKVIYISQIKIKELFQNEVLSD